jgi:hypothetical protein
VHASLFAHAFGARYELPIPLLAFVLGGAFVVAASFFVVLPTRVSAQPDPLPDIDPARRAGRVSGPIAVVVLTLLVWAGLTGSQQIPENIVPTVFWVYLWVVVPLLCGLFGDITARANPFGWLAERADSARLRRAVLGSPEPLGWPRWLGWWPAVGLFVVATLGELVFNVEATKPRFIAGTLVVYAFASLVFGLVFGARAWRSYGEFFSVVFALWGRLGWFRFGAPGRRGTAGGLEAPFSRAPSRIAFVLMLLVSISFDGLLSTPRWARFEQHTFSLGSGDRLDLFRIASLAVLAFVLLAVFWSFARAVRWAGRADAHGGFALAGLMPSMVPIAFGYLLAHYAQYVLVNGQLILPLLGAPGGGGTNLHLPYPFNDSYEVHAHFLPNAFYWYLDVVVIVGVHIVAVVLAHRHLVRAGATRALSRRAEYPWIIAMVAYTMLSLWLLAQPLTAEKQTPTTSASSLAAAVGTQRGSLNWRSVS